MFTRWNWKQAGIHYHAKPKKSERRIQKDRERMTKYNNRKRMEFEDSTRNILKEVVSKLDVVFQICHQAITNLVGREIQKQLEAKMTELKGQLNFQKQQDNKDSHQEGENSNLLRGRANVNGEDTHIGSNKSKRKRKK